MAEIQPIIVFHGRHFGICNPICVKLLQIISGVVDLRKTVLDRDVVFFFKIVQNNTGYNL